MSLEKQIATATGYDAGYWRIERIDLNIKARSLRIFCEGYKDKAAFEAGSQPVEIRRMNVERAELNDLSTTGVLRAIKAYINKVEEVVVEVAASDFASAIIDEADSV